MPICTPYNRCSKANLLFHIQRAVLLPYVQGKGFPIGDAPVVIGAMGGSGTRALVPILELAGYYLGAYTSERTQDSMATRHMLERHFISLLHQGDNPDPALVNYFSRLIQMHRKGIFTAESPWGFKNPRTMWLIPFFASLYPEMKFIHVVRDGRDMALSENRNLLRKHGAWLLQDPQCESSPVESQLRLWALGNRKAREDGQKYLGDNYFLLNYDQFCRDGESEVARLFAYLGVPESDYLIQQACRLITPSSGLGRWQESRVPLLHEPEEDLLQTLRSFGYQ